VLGKEEGAAEAPAPEDIGGVPGIADGAAPAATADTEESCASGIGALEVEPDRQPHGR
jgi:hypothetical protein